ncbi:MAG TPA: SCO family protein [Flavisolibacter sp.]|jgi:protein SCO1/2|nr:SCO family protein [Flavisolibacter sp.]
MSKKTWFYIGFFVLLVFGFFVFLSYKIPSFADPKIPPISTVQPFTFLDQDGKTISNEDVKGKVYVATFFFTTCTSVCPRLNNNLKPVNTEFKNEPNFLILSYTCDPSRDSVSKLKWYADSVLKVNTTKWIFLTGNKDSLYAMARHSYMIDDPKNEVQNGETDFLHTQLIALINKKGEVVKIYDGLKPSEISQMQAEIKKLLKEEI